jgi:O-antigen/teichoic acid export membrane protein
VFSQVFGLLLFAIQAPVLGPRAFGLVSIVMVFVGFCELVLCEAAAEALISIRTMDENHVATMNTVIVGIAAVCGVIVFAGANAGARLFGDPELAPMLRWMAILPVLSAFAATPTATTKRDASFAPLALRSMVSLLIGGSLGLVLTLTGAGVWALVWQATATRLVAAIVLWMVVPMRLRFGFSRHSLRELVVFALPMILSRLMSWATAQIPRLVLGLYWGATDLGLFGLASRLNDILLEIAVVPRYAVARVDLRRYGTDRAGLQAAVGHLVLNMSMFCFPLAIGAAAVVPTLFHAWLDPRWYGGTVPAELMLLMCVPMVTHFSVGAALLALNLQFSEAALSVAQTITTVASVLLFAPFGLIPATVAIAGRPYLLLALPTALLQKRTGVSWRSVYAAQLPVLTAAAAMGAAVVLLQRLLQPLLGSVLLLVILVAAGAGIYGALITLLVPGYVRDYAARIMSRLRPSRT